MAPDQADFTIMQLARDERRLDENMVVVVLSCDIDFIAISPPLSVNALLDPTRKTIIWKEDVLNLLDLDEEDLFHAYCIGGCDDISHNLFGVGFKKAMRFVNEHNVSEQSLCEEFESMNEEDLSYLFEEMNALKSLLWNAPATVLENLAPEESPVSLLQQFATEMLDGQRRRPGVYSLYLSVCDFFLT